MNNSNTKYVEQSLAFLMLDVLFKLAWKQNDNSYISQHDNS